METMPAYPVSVEHIPEDLRRRPAWIVWSWGERGGKRTKIPKHHATGACLDATVPTNGAAFETVVGHVGRFDGIGVLLGADPAGQGPTLAGVDLDDCRDPATGEIHPAAQAIISQLGSYAEVSPSQTGVKVLLYADLGSAEGRRKNGQPWGGDIEIYWGKRFFTVTGQHLEGTPTEVAHRQAELEALHQGAFGDAGGEPGPQVATALGPTLPTDDEQRLRAAFSAVNGDETRRLFNEPGAAGNSEGDAALCGKLAFYSDGDAACLERLLRASRRVRDKWDDRRDGETWLARECRQSLERHTGGFWVPRRTATDTAAADPRTAEGATAGAGAARQAASLLAFHQTNAGDGELFAHLFGARLRFDWRRERWLRFTGHLWEPASGAVLTHQAKLAARRRYAAACRLDDDAARKWAYGGESKARVEGALFFAKATAPIADQGDGWDADAMLLGCPNGVVDLTTATLRAGRPEDKLTLRCGVPFDPEAECPRWLAFLREVFADDDALLDFVWRAVGYSLTGRMDAQCFFMLHGRGSNGKSVFVNALRNVLGDYGADTPFSTFEAHHRASIPADLAALMGKRMVTAAETSENARLNEARIKAWTGGDPVTCRFMRENFFTYQPTGKLWLCVNHRPQVADDSEGFWRRVRLVPFERQFLGPDCDAQLPQKLLAEAPGILRWAVQGAALYAAAGLQAPPRVVAASNEWREAADPVAEFLGSCCVVDAEAREFGGALYERFRAYAKAQGATDRDILTVQVFGRRMGDRFASRRTNKGRRYEGVRVRTEDEEAAEAALAATDSRAGVTDKPSLCH